MINEEYRLHYKYIQVAVKKIKRSVKYFINKGETDMWHSVKVNLSETNKTILNQAGGSSILYYDYHLLLDQLEDGDPYEIDVYPVLKEGVKFEVDTSELLYQYHVPYDPKVFPEKADLKEYRVQIVLSEGSVVYVKAKDEEEACEKAYTLADEYAGSEYPDEYGSKCVHREFFTQQAEEVK